MSRGRRAKNHFLQKFLWFAIVRPRTQNHPFTEQGRDRERQGETNRKPLPAKATGRQVQSLVGNRLGNRPGNPFPPHRQQIDKDNPHAWRLIVTFLSFALPVGCVCLSAATGRHLLCYCQPLAIGGVGVRRSVAVCIWIDQIAYFKNYANGATVLSK